MPGDGHHAYSAPERHGAANPQSGRSSPKDAAPVMPGLWRKLQAPKGVGCGGCGARQRGAQQRGPAACAACLAVVYCGEAFASARVCVGSVHTARR